MKQLSIILILVALAMSTFTGCGGSSSNNDTNTTEENNETVVEVKSYIIETLENKDIPLSASILAQTADTKVKITRNIESDTINVSVLVGSVEVSE